MSRLATNVPTVRQRQQNRASVVQNGRVTATGPSMGGGGANFGPSNYFQRIGVGSAQASTAARYGATGLRTPTMGPIGAGATEPGQQGTLPNFATVMALARGNGRQSQWALGQARRMRTQFRARKVAENNQRSRNRIRFLLHNARARGDIERYERLLDAFNAYGGVVRNRRDR